MSQAFRYFIKGIELRGETSDPSDNVEGSVFHNSSSNRLKAYIQASIREIVTNDQSQTLTNKTIDADNNTISNIEVDNLKSGVLNTSTTLASASDTQLPSALAVKTYIDDKTAAQNEASEITFVPAGTIAATNVQTMGEELDGDIQGHINDTAAAHNASAINNIPSGNLAATDVQAALNELQSDVDTRATSSALSSHTGASSGVHGVTGSVVGTSDSQILTNKTIDASSNTISNIVDANIKANAAIDASKIGDGSVSTTEFQYLNSVTSNVQTQIDSKQATITGAATTIVSSDLSASKVVVSDASGKVAASTVSTTTLGYLDATSSIQTQINSKQATITGAATSITSTDLTASKVVVSDSSGKVAASSVSTTTLGFLDATSSVQTQLNAKVNSSGGTLTSGSIVTPIRSDVKQDTKANLTTYAATAANGQLVYATDTKEYLAVKDGTLVAIGSASGVGGTDILFAQTFETAALTDFTQTGLSLDTSAPLHGAVSAKLTHQAAVNQSFKQVVAVDRKFRGQAIVLSLNIKSAASAGNVTISVYDETNAASLLSSTQLNLSNDVDGISNTASFTIPSTSSSISYTITALPQAGSPVTYIDDVVAQLSNVALLQTSVTVPNITAWQSYVPTFQGFGTPTNIEFEYRQVGENVEVRGKFITGSCTAVEARVGLPAGLTSAGTGIIPSLQQVGFGTRNEISASSYIQVLIEPSVSYFTFGENFSAGVASLTKANASGIINNSIAMSFSASVPCAGLSATSDKTIALTQSGLVQNADSYLKATGSTIDGSNRVTSPTIASNIGSAFIVDNSAGYVKLKVSQTGIYSVTFLADGTSSGIDRQAIIQLNGVSLSNQRDIGNGAGEGFTLNNTTSCYLKTTDELTFLITGSSARTYTITSSYQGSLEQVSVSSDQKITIPTSELRFEGASARGSTATAIVKFDTLAKIRGDAFTVTNTAADGTYVTMTKDGKLDVSVSLVKGTGVGGTIYISKNQSVLTSTPTLASEILVAEGDGSSTDSVIFSPSVQAFVKSGDIIRVCSGAITPTANILNSLNLSFQEQDISVSVTNTLPQFSDSDSSIRLDGANGFGSTATTTRRFASVLQNIGSDIQYVDSPTLGSQFTVMSSGIYNVSYTEISSSNALEASCIININGTNVAYNRDLYNTVNTNTKIPSCSWSGYLNVGDVVTGAVTTAANNNGSGAFFTIAKVGKPNVTGVDVTPFVNVPQPDLQTIEALSTTSTFGSTNTGVPVLNITKNTSNGIIAIDSTAAAGTSFRALKKCTVNISITARDTTTAATAFITRNATILTVANPDGILSTLSLTAGFSGSVSSAVVLEAGDILRIQRDATFISSIPAVTLTATALSDQILTAPETFSTDTAALAYSSSYTLSTLNTAPVGTYITFTYAINSNTRTQTSTRPTQTDADMNTNGIQIFTRAYNAASTAASPAAIAIQIGKGLKGKSLDFYKSAGKVIAGSLDAFNETSTVRSGAVFKEYNEVTGILIVDAGYNVNTSITSGLFYFSDVTTATTGYLVINASKNPALTGLGLNRVAARAVNTAGTSIASATVTTVTFDATKTFDTHGALNTSTGVFTAPESGYYNCSAVARTAFSTVWAADNYFYVSLYKNGSVISNQMTYIPMARTIALGATVSDVVYLAKGDTLDMRVSHNRAGASLLETTAGAVFLSIAKVSV